MALASIAISNPQEPRWKEAAMPELEVALKDDPTAADLLAPLITFELEFGRDAEAKEHYAQFKRAAKSSPMNGLVYVNPLEHEQTK